MKMDFPLKNATSSRAANESGNCITVTRGKEWGKRTCPPSKPVVSPQTLSIKNYTVK